MKEIGAAHSENDANVGDFAAAAKLYAAGRIAEAAAIYRRILAADAGNAAARFNLASCHSSLGSYEEAIEDYKAVLLKDPLDVATLHHLGLAFLDAGMSEEAEKCFGFCLSIDDGCVRAHAPLASIYRMRGETEKAIASYRRALESPEDRVAAGHMLAALTGQNTQRAPEGYLQRFFDAYAPTFEENLLELGYRVPFLLEKFLHELVDVPETFSNALDLGCGTGLSGQAFRNRALRLTGVDLAAYMLRQAAGKDIYDRLVQAELGSFLEESGERFDLVLLTDVLVYSGNLEPLFGQLHGRLAPGGLLLFSTEKNGGEENYVLRASGRYAHAPNYIETLAARTGLELAARRQVRVRRQQQDWVEGEIYILRKEGTAQAGRHR